MARGAQPRAGAVLALCALALVACTPQDAAGRDPAGPDRGGGSEVLEAVEQSGREDVPSALDLPLDHPSLPAPLVDPDRVVSGGPPPDGIPPVDEPRFVPADDVGWLADDEAVIALSVDGQHRAYPVEIMVWHEIVNDTVAGRPVSVTYCPLCSSAVAFDRRLGERTLTFGTSGRLYLSDLVMYDRQTESLWSQIEGRAVAGVLAGEQLDRIPVQTVGWQQWRQAHPQGWVLSRETGAERDYGRNPYPGYDDAGSDPFLFDGLPDERLEPKTRVAALGDPQDPIAVPLTLLAEQRVVTLDVAGQPVVLWAGSGLRSALDAADVAAGRAVAATGAFRPAAGGQALDFAASGPDTFVDAQTGSEWDVLGRAVSGPLAGTRLPRVGHLDTFWFAWAAFHPDTRLVSSPG